MLKKNHTIQQSFSVDRSLAPEIKKGEPQDMAVDIWSLGQIAYQLLCCPAQDNCLNFSLDNVIGSKEELIRHLKLDCGNGHWKSQQIDEPFKDLIASMVLINPNQRPQIADVIEQLSHLIQK